MKLVYDTKQGPGKVPRNESHKANKKKGKGSETAAMTGGILRTETLVSSNVITTGEISSIEAPRPNPNPVPNPPAAVCQLSVALPVVSTPVIVPLLLNNLSQAAFLERNGNLEIRIEDLEKIIMTKDQKVNINNTKLHQLLIINIKVILMSLNLCDFFRLLNSRSK